MAMFNKTGVILQMEQLWRHLASGARLASGSEDDNNTAFINKDGFILEPELNLQTHRVPGPGAHQVGLGVCHHDTSC